MIMGMTVMATDIVTGTVTAKRKRAMDTAMDMRMREEVTIMDTVTATKRRLVLRRMAQHNREKK